MTAGYPITLRRRSVAGRCLDALSGWGPRQLLVATLSALTMGLVIGIATVLVPNPFFARDIAPEWWNHPVWILTSILAGMVVATYVAPADDSATPADPATEDRRSGPLGIAGGVLAFFAVGCPVCNKIAFLALGYSGAITWFAPVQPVLAVAALALTAAALVLRLQGQAECATPAREPEPA